MTNRPGNRDTRELNLELPNTVTLAPRCLFFKRLAHYRPHHVTGEIELSASDSLHHPPRCMPAQTISRHCPCNAIAESGERLRANHQYANSPRL